MPFKPKIAVLAAALLATISSPALAQDPVTLKVMSFNIWYGGEQVDFNQVIAAIHLADADFVGIQEPDGSTLRIAEAAGYRYVDLRRHIISRVPLFESGVGARTETGQTIGPDRLCLGRQCLSARLGRHG